MTDMCLPDANRFMVHLAQQLHQGQAAVHLSNLLHGGAVTYLGEGLPHGVSDWTVTHHLQQRSDETVTATCTPFPIYFHCESHRAGAVNWRMDDVQISVSPAAAAKSVPAAAAAPASPPARPAYWLCVKPESENMALFHEVMATLVGTRPSAPGMHAARKRGQTQDYRYSIDHFHMPTLQSVEPLLRAGVCMALVEQREREMVVVAPGTPHCVFTPPAASKVSRNWMSPQSLLAAAVRALRGVSGQRGEWIPRLRDQPLACLLPALRRLHVAEPECFTVLANQPASYSHLCFVLCRARDAAPELQAMAQQVAEWVSGSRSQHDLSLSSPALVHASEEPATVPMNLGGDDDDDVVAGKGRSSARADVGAAAAAAAERSSQEVDALSAALPSHPLSPAAERGVLAAFSVSCQEYRATAVARLQRQCSLAHALPLLDGLLLATVPPATVQDLCTELPSSASARDALRAINAADRQRHVRAAKQPQQAATSRDVHAGLQAKLQAAGTPLPDMWQKLSAFRERLEKLVPAEQRPPRLSLAQFRADMATWTPARLKLYRRILLKDMASVLDSNRNGGAGNEVQMVHAAPEPDNFLRWRAILIGSVAWPGGGSARVWGRKGS